MCCRAHASEHASCAGGRKAARRARPRLRHQGGAAGGRISGKQASLPPPGPVVVTSRFHLGLASALHLLRLLVHLQDVPSMEGVDALLNIPLDEDCLQQLLDKEINNADAMVGPANFLNMQPDQELQGPSWYQAVQSYTVDIVKIMLAARRE